MNTSEIRRKSFVLPIMAPVDHLFLHTVLKRETPTAVEVKLSVHDRIHICSKHERCDCFYRLLNLSVGYRDRPDNVA